MKIINTNQLNHSIYRMCTSKQRFRAFLFPKIKHC